MLSLWDYNKDRSILWIKNARFEKKFSWMYCCLKQAIAIEDEILFKHFCDQLSTVASRLKSNCIQVWCLIEKSNQYYSTVKSVTRTYGENCNAINVQKDIVKGTYAWKDCRFFYVRLLDFLLLVIQTLLSCNQLGNWNFNFLASLCSSWI